MAMTSKASKILEHLKTYGKITSWEAITLYKATRLSAIIFRLRGAYIIETEMKTRTDENGHVSSYAEYVYRGERYGR